MAAPQEGRLYLGETYRHNELLQQIDNLPIFVTDTHLTIPATNIFTSSGLGEKIKNSLNFTTPELTNVACAFSVERRLHGDSQIFEGVVITYPTADGEKEAFLTHINQEKTTLVAPLTAREQELLDTLHNHFT